MSDNKVTYGLLNWGPCVVQLKVSDDFKNKLITGAEEAKKEKLN